MLAKCRSLCALAVVSAMAAALGACAVSEGYPNVGAIPPYYKQDPVMSESERAEAIRSMAQDRASHEQQAVDRIEQR